MSRAILVLMMLASVFSVVTSAPASTNNQPGSTEKQEQKPKNNQATQEQTTQLPLPPYKKEEETDGEEDIEQLEREIETSLQKALSLEATKFKPCRHNRNGNCLLGDDCKFSHTLPKEKRSNRFTRARQNLGVSRAVYGKLYRQKLLSQLWMMRKNHALHLQYGEPLKPISKKLKERILQYQILTLVNYERIETVATALPQPISSYSSLFIQ